MIPCVTLHQATIHVYESIALIIPSLLPAHVLLCLDKVAVKGFCSALQEHAHVAAKQLPCLVAAAALALHGATHCLLLGSGFCLADAHGSDSLCVLSSLHAAFQACQLDDGLLRGSTAVRLGLLLEEQGELSEARAVARQVSGSGSGSSSQRAIGVLAYPGGLSGPTSTRESSSGLNLSMARRVAEMGDRQVAVVLHQVFVTRVFSSNHDACQMVC